MSMTINATSPGERVIVAVAILTLCGELLSDNFSCTPPSEPMTSDRCVEICDPAAVRRIDAWTCECEAGQGVSP